MFASRELRLLQMISEPDIGWCASEVIDLQETIGWCASEVIDLQETREVDCEISHRLGRDEKTSPLTYKF